MAAADTTPLPCMPLFWLFVVGSAVRSVGTLDLAPSGYPTAVDRAPSAGRNSGAVARISFRCEPAQHQSVASICSRLGRGRMDQGVSRVRRLRDRSPHHLAEPSILQPDCPMFATLVTAARFSVAGASVRHHKHRLAAPHSTAQPQCQNGTRHRERGVKFLTTKRSARVLRWTRWLPAALSWPAAGDTRVTE